MTSPGRSVGIIGVKREEEALPKTWVAIAIRFVSEVSRLRVGYHNDGETPSRSGDLGLVFAAGASDQDDPPADLVPRPSVIWTSIDGVLVVQASADRVELRDLIAHDSRNKSTGHWRRGIRRGDSGETTGLVILYRASCWAKVSGLLRKLVDAHTVLEVGLLKAFAELWMVTF